MKIKLGFVYPSIRIAIDDRVICDFIYFQFYRIVPEKTILGVEVRTHTGYLGRVYAEAICRACTQLHGSLWTHNSRYTRLLRFLHLNLLFTSRSAIVILREIHLLLILIL